jgi:hypothetical protein
MEMIVPLSSIKQTKPSDPHDPRFRLVRSPNCPNDIRREDGQVPDERHGTCGSCAWGFYTMESDEHGAGEDPSTLELSPVFLDGKHAGYRSQCGGVKLYRDARGRIGALKEVDGVRRFFPGIKGNWAFERYLKKHPALLEN